MPDKKTALHSTHVQLGAKMVSFAGYSMPIQYNSILDEHKRVRETVGVFDVSHMGEVEFRGSRALEMVNKITINDASKLEVNQAQYTAMCYPDGGIVDDLLVYRRDDHYLLVINASNIDKDVAWIMDNRIDGVSIENKSDQYSQLAVQGKNAEETLQSLTDVNLADIPFYHFREGHLAGVPMILSRTGYTGEPGFELYFDAPHSVKIWEAIFEAGKKFDIAPIGLGARDSLRLEKKYCLYGNDIDETTNPYEAGLGWITKLGKGDFVGRKALKAIKEEGGPTRKLVGFIVNDRLIPRPGYEVRIDDNTVGKVTSGAYSPLLSQNIGLAYIEKDLAKIDQSVTIVAKGREGAATVVKTPFV